MHFLMEGNYFILGNFNSHKWRVAQKDENVPGVMANQRGVMERALLFCLRPSANLSLPTQQPTPEEAPVNGQFGSGPPSKQLPHK